MELKKGVSSASLGEGTKNNHLYYLFLHNLEFKDISTKHSCQLKSSKIKESPHLEQC